MKLLCYLLPGPVTILCLLPFLMAASALVANPRPTPKQVEKPVELTPTTARTAIGTMYGAWGRARVEMDKEKMESILAPEFYVLLDGRKISREKFISDISQERVGVRLTRFDTDILTVQSTEKGWTVVITEKLEFEVSRSGGEIQKACSFWVTRDGWRKEGDKWLVTFSEAIGHENWKPGTLPPLKDW